MGVRLSIDAVMGDAEETQFNGLVGICGFEDSIYSCASPRIVQCAKAHPTSSRIPSG
ncbi:hypothetical protein GQ600_1012 [Phytophthora cactorum]|nr:hypothetical protein GQ600_1012 [Phytophthora cactorum]